MFHFKLYKWYVNKSAGAFDYASYRSSWELIWNDLTRDKANRKSFNLTQRLENISKTEPVKLF